MASIEPDFGHGPAVPSRRAGMGKMGNTQARIVSSKAHGKLKVLLVEDNQTDGELVLHELRRGGFDVAGEVVDSAGAFRQRLKERTPDIVLADYNLGQWRGMEAMEILRGEGLDIPLILVSGTLGDVTAVECIKQGATDYVLKDSLARLPESVRRALQETETRKGIRLAHEELARKVEELARSNAELEQFAYVASHDLQEPLRMVANYTQLLAERYRGKLDDQADKFIHYAVDGAVRMQTLIQDLMAFSRAGRQETSVTRTDCNQIVKQALGNLQGAIHESGARVTFDALPVVTANMGKLRQIFQNLIGNAIKFRGIEPPVIHIGKERKGNTWIFAVADNGIGIAPENWEIIFAVFRRLHTQTEYSGNGIGLAICKRIVEQAGGKIWVEPQEATGSIFKFTWPASARVAPAFFPEKTMHVDLQGNTHVLWEQKGSVAPWNVPYAHWLGGPSAPWAVPSPDGRHLAIYN
jgi:signal transduction histidine kinase